jgi:hypothetical protein
VHAKQERGRFAIRVEIELVTAIGAACIGDPETVPVGPPGSSVPVGREGVAHQIESLTGRRSDRDLERSGPRVRVRDNARATRDQRVLNPLDDGLSSDDRVFSQQTPNWRTFEAYAYGKIPRCDGPWNWTNT